MTSNSEIRRGLSPAQGELPTEFSIKRTGIYAPEDEILTIWSVSASHWPQSVVATDAYKAEQQARNKAYRQILDLLVE
jgi:hypothetical protein